MNDLIIFIKTLVIMFNDENDGSNKLGNHIKGGKEFYWLKKIRDTK